MALLAIAEIALFAIAAALGIRRRLGGGAAECLALGSAAALAGLSAIYQLAFLLRAPELSALLEVPFALAALGYAWRERGALRELTASARAASAPAPVAATLLLSATIFLLAQALLLPPFGNDPLSYHLTRVLLFEQERTLFPAEFSKYDLVVKTLGADILAHAFLRFGTDRGVAALPLLAWVASLAAGYALARREARCETAWLAVLCVAGMPQFVHQAAVFKSNVFALMAALACLLLARRVGEAKRAGDAALLALMLAFGVSARPNFLSFAVPFALAFGLLVLRAGARDALRLIASWRRPLLASLVPVLVLSQLWLFARNQLDYGHPGGPASFVAFHRNDDGLIGALANAVRYALQSLDWTAPGDSAWRALTGATFSDWLERLYDSALLPILGQAGHSATFRDFGITASAREETSWFGPLGAALALPALAAAALRGSAQLRAAVCSLLAYAAIFSAGVAWFPWNARMLALVFAGSTPAIAWALERVTPSRALRIPLTAIAAALLAFSCWTSQPPGAFRDSDFGRRRLYWLRQELGPHVAEIVRRGFEPGSDVLLVVNQGTPTAPILLAGRGARFTLVWPWLRSRIEPGFDLARYIAERRPPFRTLLCLAPEEPLCRAPAPGSR